MEDEETWEDFDVKNTRPSPARTQRASWPDMPNINFQPLVIFMVQAYPYFCTVLWLSICKVRDMDGFHSEELVKMYIFFNQWRLLVEVLQGSTESSCFFVGQLVAFEV